MLFVMSALTKLSDARHARERAARAGNAEDLRRAFSEVLSALISVNWLHERETKARLRSSQNKSAAKRFDVWWKEQMKARNRDELLAWLDNERDVDIHGGTQSNLAFNTFVSHLDTSQIGPPPFPGAALVIGNTGAFWQVHAGTVREQLIPIEHAGVHTSFQLGNVPKVHLGQPIDGNPMTVLDFGIAACERMIEESRRLFP